MPITTDGRIEYKMPKDIKDQLTEAFVSDFHEAVIETFKQNDRNQDREPFEYETYTYYAWWLYMEGTAGYCQSFRQTCDKHGLNKVLMYYNKLQWYDSDLFDSEVGDLLVHFGFVELGEPEEESLLEENEER